MDGRKLAFIANDNGVPKIWVRELDAAGARPVAGTDRGQFPFWSRDGLKLGFFAEGKLKRVDLPDGMPRALADAPEGRGGSWNADDVIIYAPATVGPLMRISAGGGAPEPVTRLALDRGSHRWPQFLPDGRRYLFLTTLVPAGDVGTHIGSLDNFETRRVLPNPNGALFAPPGALLSVFGSTLVATPFDPSAGAVTGEPVTLAEDVSVSIGGFRGSVATSEAGIIHIGPFRPTCGN